MDNKNIIVGAVLLTLGGGSLWLAQRSNIDPPEYRSVGHTPDYYLEGVDSTQMNPDGSPSQRLLAERLTHYPDDDSTELKLPSLTIYDETRPPWRVRSETGWLSGDGEILLLQGKVKIDRSAAPGVRPMHIRTRDLRVQPRDNYMETDALVDSRSGNSRLRAKGMQAWFNQPIRIKLLANVRGHYELQP
jgi:lipopolysaccharide export system protein LptC